MRALMMIVILALSTTFSLNIAAGEGRSVSVLAKVREINSGFLSGNSIDTVEEEYLYSPLGNTVLYIFVEDNEQIGYCITVDDLIVEFAESAPPYSAIEEEGNCWYYDFSCYKKITNETASQITIDRSWKSEITSKAVNVADGLNRASSNTLSGVTLHLQGSVNCIAHALSEVLWYWGGISGYSALISGQTFASLRTAVDNCFDTYYNEWVPFAARAYGWAHGNFWFYGNVTWSPSINEVTAAIDSGRPCMVGFAAGSEYSSTVGHMTMCYGYYIYSTQKYVILADGWSTGYVYKLWTSYNDCVITLYV